MQRETVIAYVEGAPMHMQSRSLIGTGLLSLAMALSLAGCGGGASAPAEDPAPQEEAAAEAEGTPEDEAAADGEAEDTVADADAVFCAAELGKSLFKGLVFFSFYVP